MRKKISAVYKITNTVTNDFYIGSSKNIKQRWASHKWPSIWNKHPNNQMYLDMQKYGVDKFEFEILEEVKPEYLKEREQWFIEMMKPTYNSNRANGFDFDKYKEYQKKYHKTDKYKEYYKEYQKSNEYKKTHRKDSNKYNNQLCCYNNETITLAALSTRFRRAGIEHPTLEAKKYILKNFKDK